MKPYKNKVKILDQFSYAIVLYFRLNNLNCYREDSIKFSSVSEAKIWCDIRNYDVMSMKEYLNMKDYLSNINAQRKILINSRYGLLS